MQQKKAKSYGESFYPRVTSQQPERTYLRPHIKNLPEIMKKNRTEAEQQEIDYVMNLLMNVNEMQCELTKKENLAIRDAIMKYDEVASVFFFQTISPMIWGFVKELKETYKADVPYNDVATIVYTEIYNGGRWSRIKGYLGNASFFGWVSRVAAQVLIPQLEASGLVSLSRVRTSSNTSLTLKSMKYREERRLVVRLVKVVQLRKLLHCIYVARMTEDETKRMLGMSDEVFKESFSLAQQMLKEQLIARKYYYYARPNGGKVVNLVSLALSDKVQLVKTNSIETVYKEIKMKYDEDEHDFLKEQLDPLYPGLPVKAQWNQFVIDFACEKMDWSEEDKAVWVARFRDGESPVELADRLGHPRSWVDNRYSRLNKQLAIAIRLWWNER